MEEIRIIKNINPVYNRSLIYTRLGYNKNYTELSPELNKEVESIIQKAENALEITVAYRFIKIANIKSPTVEFEDGIILSGQRLSKLLIDSHEALLMAATGGNKIMELIAKLQTEKLMSEALVVDAAASVITDAALDFTMSMINQKLSAQRKFLTNIRFSPGYDDFNLSHQIDFYRLLKAESLGIIINEAFMLTPEKSVFAVAGILGE